ncbi:MAG: hypothetical protein JNL11_02980 [Bdellovibrionaceae bacterium]|nr:hypothetical protein [Pseudobdellovibrionaceae bacterium]
MHFLSSRAINPDAHGIPNEIFARVRELLTEQEMSDLTYSVGVINFYNRLNFAFPKAPGTLDSLFGLDKAGLK